MRVCTPSNAVSVMARAGTKLPHCAMSASVAVCRTKHDFPPMFGPVTTNARGFSEPFVDASASTAPPSPPFVTVITPGGGVRVPGKHPSLTELGTTRSPPASVASSTGWRPSRMSRNAAAAFSSPLSSLSSASSRNVGQQYPSCLASAASEHSASSPAAARVAARSSRNFPAHSTLRKWRQAASQARTCRSRARSSAAARASTAGGWYRTTLLLLFVLTRTQSCGTPSAVSGSSMRCSTSATVT